MKLSYEAEHFLAMIILTNLYVLLYVKSLGNRNFLMKLPKFLGIQQTDRCVFVVFSCRFWSLLM